MLQKHIFTANTKLPRSLKVAYLKALISKILFSLLGVINFFLSFKPNYVVKKIILRGFHSLYFKGSLSTAVKYRSYVYSKIQSIAK